MKNYDSAKNDDPPEDQDGLLIDCGQASRVTKGYMFNFIPEVSWPPFDRQYQ